MRKDLFELWGNIMLEMARLAKETPDFFSLFQDGFARKTNNADALYDQLVSLCRKTYGKDGIEAFNAVLNEFYENVGVVPRAQYNELEEKYHVLIQKVKALEEKIEVLKKRIQKETNLPSDLMSQWTETAKTYAEIHQQFFKEFSKFFKS